MTDVESGTDKGAGESAHEPKVEEESPTQEEIEEQHRRHPPLPGHVGHSCTDTAWLIVFLLASIGAGYIAYFGIAHGSLLKLYHGYNFHRQLCGSGQEELQGYTFWCANATRDGLLLEYPICVTECPRTDKTFHDCIDPRTGIATQTQDYGSHSFGYFCFPIKEPLSSQLAAYAFDFQESGYVTRIFNMLSQFLKAWIAVAIAGILAIAIGYAYIFLLDQCPEIVAMTCMALLTLIPLVAGGWTLYRTFIPDESSRINAHIQDFGFFEKVGIGGGLFIVGFICSCVAYKEYPNIRMTVGCVDAAAECMWQAYSMLLEPLVSITIKVVVMTGTLLVLALLTTTGQEKEDSNGPAGVHQELVISTEVEIYCVLFGLYAIWVFEASMQLSIYSLAFATQIWYFTPYVNGVKEDMPPLPLFIGLGNGLVFHVGSVCYSAFLTMWFRFPGYVLGFLYNLRCLRRLCGRLAKCYTKTFILMGNSAHMDTALTSSNYCVSAQRSLEVLKDEVQSVSELQGALWMFHLAGVGICIAGSAGLTDIMLRTVPAFTSPTSSLFVWNKKAMVSLAGLCGFAVGASLMLVLDTVFDTILYCYATEMRRRSQVSDHLQYNVTSEEGGIRDYLCFLPADEPEDDYKMTYMPPRLNDLLTKHQKEIVQRQLQQRSDESEGYSES